MANPEHVDILKKGSEVWNKWRDNNPNIKPILCDSDLKWLHLIMANLEKANLRNADFTKANLSGANFFEADLTAANLGEANLIGAKLIKANLIRANLSASKMDRCNLSEANLSYAILNNASLNGANLSWAILNNAKLHEADLSWAVIKEAELNEAELNSAFLRRTDLSKANFSKASLNGALLSGAVGVYAKLTSANLSGANLDGANMTNADLNEADLSRANISNTDLRGASLEKADLNRANLSGANLSQAILIEANLEYSTLVETSFEGANISSSRIYGISAWNLKFNQKTKQNSLIITGSGEPVITVDNLEVAQFVYLLLHNEKIRNIIDTIGQKGVLILGRFIPERKAVLDAIRNELRRLGFVPILFDFEKPTQRDFTETIKTLAGISRFIIADITNPKCSPLELQAIMPDYMIPFVPIIHEDEEPFAMFRDLKQKYGEWMLDLLEYDSAEGLIEVLDEAIVRPALDKANELIDKKTKALKTRHVKGYKKMG